MKLYLIFLLLSLSFSSHAQQNNDIIKNSTIYFTLDSVGNFNGDGAKFIMNKITDSQFFLIGEQHDVHSIETFVSSLIPHLKESDYNNYLTEIGPISANKLNDLKLSSFNLNYYNSKYLYPFGFYRTIEEKNTLNQLNKYNIKLWGVDFDSYSSYLFLIDEIYKNADKKRVSKILYNKVYSFIELEYKKGENNFNPNLMESIINSNDVNQFLTLSKNDKNIPIIEQFLLSLNINHQITLGFWQQRVDNMKMNFTKYYHSLKAENNFVKLFIKLGSVHTARGKSFSGNLEVGNMIYELANLNLSKSFSLIIFPRYILNKETKKVEDLIEEGDIEILKYAFPDQWTIIDLVKLQELSILKNINLSKSSLDYIEKYDAIVIPPTTFYSEKTN